VNLAEILVKPDQRKLGELTEEQPPMPPPPSGGNWSETAKIWVVFVLCLLLTVLGVLVSFLVFGSTITGTRKWGVALVVSTVMLGLSYGAKYSNSDARGVFTPVDALQYLSQAFLWPSTWPALADLVGIEKVAPPVRSNLLEHGHSVIVAALTSLN
jgi:hypothetical protein